MKGTIFFQLTSILNKNHFTSVVIFVRYTFNFNFLEFETVILKNYIYCFILQLIILYNWTFKYFSTKYSFQTNSTSGDSNKHEIVSQYLKYVEVSMGMAIHTLTKPVPVGFTHLLMLWWAIFVSLNFLLRSLFCLTIFLFRLWWQKSIREFSVYILCSFLLQGCETSRYLAFG